MKRSLRSGLVAGLLALTLTGAACGSGSSNDGEAAAKTAKAAKTAEQAGAVETPTTLAPAETPATPEVTAPVAVTPTTTAKPAPARPATTPTTAKPAEVVPEKKKDPVSLRLGYFPNLTHAAAIAGVEKGFFADKLGADVDLKTATFNAGPSAVEALFANSLDATYIGPNPSINAFVKSKSEAIRIISGATSGGAALVVNPSVNGAADLKGQKVGTPQLGNTQDVALRAWLAEQGLKTDPSGGGDVSIVPQENSQILAQFKSGQLAGGWVPEPWATRLVQEAGGKVLVDERTLWPAGDFVTTQLIVRTEFLKAHPDVVERLIQGHIAATDYLNQNPAEGQSVVNGGLVKLTGQAMNPAIIAAAWDKMKFTYDPIAASLKKGAENAKSVGLLEGSTKLDGIYDLSLLNKVLASLGREPVKD